MTVYLEGLNLHNYRNFKELKLAFNNNIVVLMYICLRPMWNNYAQYGIILLLKERSVEIYCVSLFSSFATKSNAILILVS